MCPKFLDNLDEIDKLIEIAEKRKPAAKVTKPNPEIDSFITALKIKPGKKRVPSYVIYYYYYLWKQTRLIPHRKFYNYFATKFEKTRTDHGIGFFLDPKSIKLDTVIFFKARQFLRKQRDEAKEE